LHLVLEFTIKTIFFHQKNYGVDSVHLLGLSSWNKKILHCTQPVARHAALSMQATY